MFPFRDHNPSRHTPYVTWALIAINIAIFVIYAPIMGDDMKLSAFYNDWAMIPHEITNVGEYHTMISSMFLHGGFMHLAGNMLFLWIYGDNIEDQLGHVMYLAFYILAGVGAALFHIMADANSMIPTIGASGAIAGVMGAYLVMFPKAKIAILWILVVFFKIFTLPAFVVLGFWMVMQTFGGFSTPADGGGVAYWAHIGGFLVGAVMIVPIWLSKGGAAFWSKTHFHPPHKETFSTRTTTIPTIRRKR
jgi:membrane associated rhomboid family serine protease